MTAMVSASRALARLNLDMVATVEFLPVQTYGVTPGTSKDTAAVEDICHFFPVGRNSQGVDCATHL